MRKMARPRIEINHKTSTTLARYACRYIEISAYLLSGSTRNVLPDIGHEGINSWSDL